MSDVAIVRGKAAALRIDNLDTDQIMPKQFLRGIDKHGLAKGLLYDLRFDPKGTRLPDFVLNRPERAGTQVLVGGFNFGCGSSREHAVWGLLQYGIRAVIAPSYAEIFYSNAMGNRLLLLPLPTADVESLMLATDQDPTLEVTIDVRACTVQWPGHAPVSFPISERHRRMFLRGTDTIGDSLAHRDEIRAFAQGHWERQPWLKDVASRMKVAADSESMDKKITSQ